MSKDEDELDFSDYVNEDELARLEKTFKKIRPSELMMDEEEAIK